MPLQYINTGAIANDGTGDALREAFIKVNDNFEDLDLRVIESTPIENVGSIGVEIYAGKTNGVHGIKRLIAGTNVSLSQNNTSITVDVPNFLDELLVISDNGSLTIAPGQSVSVSGGNGISTSTSGQNLVIELDSTNIVSRDSSPTLSADLNANGNDIVNANLISSTTFNGTLEGLVYGYDVREFGPYLSGFDFGRIRNTYNNALEFIISNVDLDFGPIDPDSGDTVDLGFLPPVPSP